MKVGAKVNLFNYELRNQRIKLGYTQAQIAQLVGIHQTIYGAIELLQRPPLSVERWQNVFDNISDVLGCPVEKLFPKEYLNTITNKHLKTAFYLVKDIDLELLPSGDTTFLSLPNPEETTEIEETKQAVISAIEKLSPKEKKVIELNYGIGCEKHTLEETAREFGVTRERIRQIEARALSRLRNPEHKLRAYQD